MKFRWKDEFWIVFLCLFSSGFVLGTLKLEEWKSLSMHSPYFSIQLFFPTASTTFKRIRNAVFFFTFSLLPGTGSSAASWICLPYIAPLINSQKFHCTLRIFSTIYVFICWKNGVKLSKCLSLLFNCRHCQLLITSHFLPTLLLRRL